MSSGPDAGGVSLVWFFDDPAPPGDPVTLLGGKGAGLASMTAAGLPVPPGFTLTTIACRRHLDHGWDDELEAAVRRGIEGLERRLGRRLGDPVDPLLVSVRSGAPVSMPGMMDTLLDVGMTPAVETALATRSGDASFAADTRRRAEAALASVGLSSDLGPADQVVGAIRAVFESWDAPRAARYRDVEGIDASLGTAATVQAMVFGNLDDRSGTGVAFTRDPATGRPGLMGDFLPGAQGDDVVAGDHATLSLQEMAATWPDQYAELDRMAGILERTMADMVDIEFTVEAGRLWLLQCRRGKRSPIAAFRCAIDMAEDPDFPVDRAEAVRRCERYFDDPPIVAGAADEGDLVEIARGLAASPGRVSGVLCLDPDRAVDLEAEGHPVVLARNETSPADVHGMAAAVGLFTRLGGLVSHAAVVARDWGLPAVVGAAEAKLTETGVTGPGGFVAEGEVVTVDGDEGLLFRGSSDIRSTPAPEVAVVRSWAAELRAGDASATAPDADAASALPEQVTFAVFHALRIKGMATSATLAGIAGVDEPMAEQVLTSLVAVGHATFLEGRSMWRLTPEGRDAHAVELADRAAALDLTGLGYDAFLELNDEFKLLCTDWQLRDGEPNDHTDAAHDAAIVARLGSLDDRAQPVVAVVADVIPWTGPYGSRLAAARARLAGGDQKALTGVFCDSYHDIWMELHEDLILTQGIDRAAEGST